jgi:hypothetical protein
VTEGGVHDPGAAGVDRLNLLEGAVDSHVHAAPFINDESFLVDVFELAQEAKQAGLAAVVLKSYFGSSCPAAYLANRYAGGARVLGGVTLNRSVGGFNADAVRVAAYEGSFEGFRPGRVVWMPERSSLHRARFLGLSPEEEARSLSPYPAGDTSREILPEARKVLEVIAEEDLVLATSHLSPTEAIALLEVAGSIGVRRSVITHASNPAVAWTLDEKLGALIEEAAICWEPAMALFHYSPTDAQTEIFDAMRAIGPKHYVLASDSGFRVAPAPAEAMRVFVELLHAGGFSVEEIRTMAVDNPRRLFRLDDPPDTSPMSRDRLGN